MARQPGYRVSPEGKGQIKQALRSKDLFNPRADDSIIRALEKEKVYITAKTWQRFWDSRHNIDRTTFKEICQFLGLDWQEIVLPSQNQDRCPLPSSDLVPSDLVPSEPVPSEPNFYGRKTELHTLQGWVTNEICRLVILYGLDGIGKSSLVRQLTARVTGSFQRVEWKTFSYGDSIESTLIDLLQQLDSQNSFSNLSPQQLKDRFWRQLQQKRCLVILEQVQDDRVGKYDDYKNLLRELLGNHNGKSHSSCSLLITSFEKPDEVTAVADRKGAAQSFHLKNVDAETGLEILKNREPALIADLEAATELIKLFNGHPLALKLVSSHIRDFHSGNVREFLNNLSVPKRIDDILRQLIKDLDRPARAILNILKNSDPMTQPELQKLYNDLVPDVADVCNFTRAQDTLLRRSLLIEFTGDTDYSKTVLYGLDEATKQVVRRYFSMNT